MKKVALGRSGIAVSQICLGSMTWGSQNSEAEGHAQMDQAAEAGVNFVDTAEMYPTTPQRQETFGRTEEIIGSYLARARREDWVIATKITGEGHSYVRDGAIIDGPAMRRSVEGSLTRLRTDYIDLYQMHWPNRGSYHFRQYWRYDPTSQTKGMNDHVDEILGVAQDLIAEGKIRAIGMSNETTWGLAQWVRAAEERGLPRVASVQNEYSLLCRLADLDLAELCHHEDIPILAFSPAACGMLSGKYRNGQVPDGSRRSINDRLGGRVTDMSVTASVAYADLARSHGLDPVTMAVAFCLARPVTTIPIIGATTPAQLSSVLDAANTTLPDAVLADIAAVHRTYPQPM